MDGTRGKNQGMFVLCLSYEAWDLFTNTKKEKGENNRWLSCPAAAPTGARITCPRWNSPFLEEACVWDTTHLDSRQWSPCVDTGLTDNPTIFNIMAPVKVASLLHKSNVVLILCKLCGILYTYVFDLEIKCNTIECSLWTWSQQKWL